MRRRLPENLIPAQQLADLSLQIPMARTLFHRQARPASPLETLRRLKRRGLDGVDVVVSDAHAGLVSALERCFQGAIWQRCHVHFRRNVVDRAPKSCHDELHSGLNRILKAEEVPAAHHAFAGLCKELEGRARRGAGDARGRPEWKQKKEKEDLERAA